ncbi:hyoothetical protein [Pochonia chlamydosporia 170]|uniref:Hyoothetical protein n=1 Tax=Pochonia chlamydosporia 170 TaxID=1380566 RepID=A0A179FAA7_METCM|nr:hyoothetical protein [Pochonia chlamydosporia 170]OAQ62221.1 hyoothetical protein [Pochonia chlamydosporia 170]
MPADFEKQSYWHSRFASETSFEWLLSSSDFVSLIEPYLKHLDPSSAHILNLGSGTSDLHNHLRSRGFHHVSNLDYEPLAVVRGKHLEEKAFGDIVMHYTLADATQLNHAGPEIGHRGDGKFDLVIDKSTVDAISCGGQDAFLRMAHGVRNRLADDAVWISLSLSASRFDDTQLPFNVETVAKIPTSKIKPTDPDVHHWCYLLRPI